jgi:hypothetical protein
MEENIKIITLPEPKSKKNIKKEKREKKITKNHLWMENITEYELKIEHQYDILIGLINNVKSDKTKLLRKLIKEKIDGYKHQDVLKKKLNDEKFISLENILNILEKSKLECYYCKKNVMLFYRYAHDLEQWTLERIDNNFGHNDDNVEISCLKCNICRRTMQCDKYKFTKQVIWEKVN